MTAYVVIIRESTTDIASLDRYRELAPIACQGRTFSTVAYYGEHLILEGSSFEGAVILRFPTMDEAMDWYQSPDYQTALAHRKLGSKSRAFVIEGMPDQASP